MLSLQKYYQIVAAGGGSEHSKTSVSLSVNVVLHAVFINVRAAAYIKVRS